MNLFIKAAGMGCPEGYYYQGMPYWLPVKKKVDERARYGRIKDWPAGLQFNGFGDDEPESTAHHSKNVDNN